MFSAEGQWSFFVRSLDLMSSHYLIGTLLMQSAASRNNAKLVLDEKKMISNRFILITNRAFYSSSPFLKCSLFFCKSQNGNISIAKRETIGELCRSHICQFEKSLLKRNQFLTGHTNAAISLQRWFWLHESLSRSQWDSEIWERERERGRTLRVTRRPLFTYSSLVSSHTLSFSSAQINFWALRILNSQARERSSWVFHN